MDDWRENYDWQEAFGYASNVRTATLCSDAPANIDDVAEVIAKEEGENDGASWIMIGRLKDGRYFFLEAGCDYTGWDCQAGGDIQMAGTLDDLHRFGMTEDARQRLGIKLEEK